MVIHNKKVRVVTALLSCLLMGTTFGRSSKKSKCDVNWPSYTKTFDNHRNACAERKINACNAKNLAIKLTFPAPFQISGGSPIIVDDVLYFVSGRFSLPNSPGFGRAFAFNAFDPSQMIWQSDLLPAGLYNLSVHAVGENLLYFANSGGDALGNSPGTGVVFALDKRTGRTVVQRNILELPDQRGQAVVGGMVLIEKENLLIVTLGFGGINLPISSYGSIMALRADTLATVWRYNITHGTDPNDPRNFGSTGGGIFSTPAVDTKTGILYVGTGQNLTNPITQLTDALLAFNYRTGQLIWSRQFTTDDVNICTQPVPNGCNATVFGKDWDASGGPLLINIKDNQGRCRKLAVIGTKQGIMNALDTENAGELVWSTFLTPPAPTGYLLNLPANNPGLFCRDANNNCTVACTPSPVPCGVAVPGSANSGVNGFPATDGKTIYVISSYSLTGTPITNLFGTAGFGFGPIVAGSTLFALRACDGKILWRQDFTGLAVNAVAVANGVVYSVMPLGTGVNEPNNAPLGGVFRAHDAETGKLLFEYIDRPATGSGNTAFGSPTIYKGMVYVPMGITVPRILAFSPQS